MDDKQIVDLFWERSENAISETEKKYGRYCHYIAYQILGDDGYADEIVNDTYLKTWNTIPENRPAILKSYVGMISRQLSLNKLRQLKNNNQFDQNTLVIDELSECISDGESDADFVNEIVFADCINKFLFSLPQTNRNIFIRRYWYMSSIAEIAKDYSMKESAVSMLLHRIRNKLKKKLEQEDIYL